MYITVFLYKLSQGVFVQSASTDVSRSAFKLVLADGIKKRFQVSLCAMEIRLMKCGSLCCTHFTFSEAYRNVLHNETWTLSFVPSAYKYYGADLLTSESCYTKISWLPHHFSCVIQDIFLLCL